MAFRFDRQPGNQPLVNGSGEELAVSTKIT